MNNLLFLLFAQLSYYQDIDTLDVGADVFDEIIITATRTPHSIHAVPASISVIDRRTIESIPAVFADEALKGLSGVYVKRGKIADTSPSVSLRGFSGDARTLVLLDGIPLNDGYNQNVDWSGVSFDAVSRIEVVKGSFSALYGGNAMGGVINILTEIPKEEAFSLNTSYGTYNTFNISAGYSNRFLKNKNLALFLSANQKSSDGYPANLYQASPATAASADAVSVAGWTKTTSNTGATQYLLGHLGDNWLTQNQLFGKISYGMNPNSTLEFSASYSSYAYGYRNPRTFLANENGRPVTTGQIIIDNEGEEVRININSNNFTGAPGAGFTNTYKLHYKTKIHNVTLTSYVSYLRGLSEYKTLDAGATVEGGPGRINSSNPLRQTYFANAQADIPVGNHLLSLGFDYKMYNAGVEEWRLSNWRDDASKTDLLFSMNGKQAIYAPFVQAEINIIDGLKTYIGARYDYWVNFEGEGIEASDETIYDNTSKGQLSPKLGIVYIPEMQTDNFKIRSVRASAGQSFRTPTLYQLYRTWYWGTTTYLCNPELDPETSFSWETGITLSLFNDWTKISFDYYQSFVNDLIYNSEISNTDGRRALQQMNAATGEIKGFEFEIKQNILSFLNVNFNMTRQNTEITSNSADVGIVGKRFTNVPNLLYNIGINLYRGPFNFMLSYHYTDKVHSTAANTDVVQGVHGSFDEQKLLDGKFSYILNEKINLSLSVNNILDREYFLSNKAPGRRYTLGVSAKF